MTDAELRAIVRDVVAQHLGARPDLRSAGSGDPRHHPSHTLLRMAPSVEKGQPCIIEPHVGCSLCGYCQSHGH